MCPRISHGRLAVLIEHLPDDLRSAAGLCEDGQLLLGAGRRRHLRGPAEFVAEGLDQTRGWFYTLTVLAAVLYDKPAFRNVIVNGQLVLDGGTHTGARPGRALRRTGFSPLPSDSWRAKYK